MYHKRINVIVLTSIAVTILLLLYFFYKPTQESFYPKCIFYTLTHLYCPGCGSQRAIHALLHGHLQTAAHYNLLFVMAIPLVIYTALAYTWNTFFDQKLSLSFLYKPLFPKLILILVLFFWIGRNLPFTPFTWLAP